MSTAFQPNAFQSDSFQQLGGVTATDFQATFAVIEGGDIVSLQIGLPFGAGSNKRKRRDRYIARFKGQDHEFGTLEDLEEFIESTKAEESNKPKRNRAPIKITLTPEFAEEASAVLDIPRRIESMPPSVALAQIRRIDYTLERLLAEANRKAEEEAEDMLLWLI